MLKRPNPKETEEDLLLQQQEFLRRRSAGQASAQSTALQNRLKGLQKGDRGKSGQIRRSVMSPVVERNYPPSAYNAEADSNRKHNNIKQEELDAPCRDRRRTEGPLPMGNLQAKPDPNDTSEQQLPNNDRRTIFMDILRMKDELRLSPSCTTTKQSQNPAPKKECEDSVGPSRFLNDTSILETTKDLSINRVPRTSTMYYSFEKTRGGITNMNPDASRSFLEFKTPAIPTDSFFQNADKPTGEPWISCANIARPPARRKTTFAKHALPVEHASSLRRFSLNPKATEVEAIRQEVHKENAALLAKMSESEIANLRKQILGNAEPPLEILKLLTSRRKNLPACEEIRKLEEARKATEDVALPFNVDPSWLNMGVVEKEKLEWTSDLPTQSDVSKEPPTWRFDLEGNLLPVDADVPIQSGLHHHGDEPHRPGYNLKELLCLSRSALLNQRLLSVSTLAKIVQKAASALFKNTAYLPLFDELKSENAIVLIRLCFDDRAGAMLSACLRFFEALICRPSEEELLDFTLECCGGLTQPWLRPTRLAGSKESKSLSDDEIVKVDVVESLTRTQFLQRLDSVFHQSLIKLSSPAVGDPGGATVGATVLNILCRMARHSVDACNQIIACEQIFQNWLPGCLSDVEDSIVPRAKLIRLIRILSYADKAIAAQLVHQAGLLPAVLQLIAAEPSDFGNESSACNLICECYRYWRCVISYGLELEHVRNLHNMFVDQIRQACNIAGEQLDLSQPHFSFIRLRLLVATLESYLIASRHSCRAEAVSMANNCFRGLALSMYRIVSKCTENCLSGVHASYSVLLAAMFNYFATSAHLGIQSLFNPRDNCFVAAVKRFGKSVSAYVRDLTKWSFFLQPNESLKTSVDWISPPLGVHCLIDLEGKFSPFPLCASWVRLLHFSKLPCHQMLFSTMTNCKSMEAYLANMAKLRKFEEHSVFFARFETYFLHYVTLLGITENVDICKISLQFPRILSGGQEFLYCETVRSVISEKCLLWPNIRCSEQFPVEQWNSNLVASLDCLMSIVDFHKIVFSSLPEVRMVMIDNYNRQHREIVERSKAQLNACGFFSEDIPLLTTNVEAWSTNLHNGHWFLIPMHQHVLKIATPAENPPDDSEGLRLVICTLLLSFLAMMTGVLVRPAELYCYLCELFYTGYFKEPLVYQCLGIILRDCFSKQKKIGFRIPWQGETFASFYSSLVDRFNTHSYGDVLFAHYLLLPLVKGSDRDVIAALFSSEQPSDSFIANLECTPNEDLIGPIEVSKDKGEVEAFAKVLQSGIRKGSVLHQLALRRLGIQ
ncbi:hypothetical protein M514_03782 [Trichuris suis]|uniref:Uncharacterized protein n=1 Tax=Trichuris suis TaxID=68888 RepID=A0A085MZM6_9BILA|nr:hypothetical protein M514_03782 [Trichuris suis]